METEEKKFRLPKYLAISQMGKISVINYYENLDELSENIEDGKITTVYVRSGSLGKWWEYFADMSRGVYND